MEELDEKMKRNNDDCHSWAQSSRRDAFEMEMTRNFQDPQSHHGREESELRNKSCKLQDQRLSIQA